MADFVVHVRGELIMLYARNHRALRRLRKLAETKVVPPSDRALLSCDRAREVVDELNFEGYRVEGRQLL